MIKQLELSEFESKARHCRNCGAVLKSNQPVACSRKCSCVLAAKASGDKQSRNTMAKALSFARLYAAGATLKEICNQTGVGTQAVSRALKAIGAFDFNRIPKQKQKKPIEINSLIVDQYRAEEKWLKRNENHWGKHPCVDAWMNHWRDKSASCKRAAATYNKRKHDPEYKLRRNLRHRLWFFTIKQGRKKHDGTMNLVGCSAKELRAHIESKFKDGMSWDNYGRKQSNGWEIDHIKPCTSFDLTDPKQQAECFHYTNLQPMWKSDNIRKGGVRKPLYIKNMGTLPNGLISKVLRHSRQGP